MFFRDIVFSIIGAYYYLRVVRLMYFDEGEQSVPLAVSADSKFTLSLNGLLVLLLGISPNTLMLVCVASL